MDNNSADNDDAKLDDNQVDNGEVLVDCNVLNNDEVVKGANGAFNNGTVSVDESGKLKILSCIVIPPLIFDNVDLDKTQNLLNSWGLSVATCELLKAYGYNTLAHLEALNHSDIDEIFVKLDFTFFGERSLLKKRLFEWKESRGVNTTYDATVSMSNATTTKVLEWLEKISNEICSSKTSSSKTTWNTTETSVTLCPNSDTVTSVLQATIKGQQVLISYDNFDKLNSTNQKDLTQCLVDFYKSKSRKMTYLEMQQWANAIEERFPNEKSGTYFLPRKPGKKNPTGKLPSKWSNVALVNESECPSKQISEPTQNLLITDEMEMLKLWLFSNMTPWDLVTQNWRKTAALRMNQLQNLQNLSLGELLNEWPRFNDENGYQLIDIDFEFMFPDKINNLLRSFDDFITKVVPVLETEIKDKASRNLYKTIKMDGIDSNSKDCIVSLLLNAILHPKRLNKRHKPTILEAEEDFVLHVTSFNIMHEKLEKMQEENKLKKSKIQPRIVVVGPELSKLNHFYVYLDGLKYKLGSFKKCLDLVIKISYVFQLKYSDLTKQVWSFLENYFFELESERFPEVINLINILKTQN